MKKMKLFFLRFFLIALGLVSNLSAQTTIPGDSLVFGPMFSPVYDNSVRVWFLTKHNTGSGNELSLSMTSESSPETELFGTVFQSDDRLGYSLRSYIFSGLTPDVTYTAKLMIDGVASERIASIKNEYETIDDFKFLSGGCGRIYDTSRCIDIPESYTHFNGDPEMFNLMATEDSDLMVWLGDAVYLLGLQHANGQCPDGIDDWANRDTAFARFIFYRQFHDQLTQAMPQLSITDNHDTGPNEFDKTMPTLPEMRENFMEWWPNPEYLSTAEGQGLFSSYTYKDVEFFLTDNRSYRDGILQHFGPEQLEWLKQGLLNSTAKFKVIVNGTPSFKLGMGGRNFASSEQAVELVNFIKENNINGVLSYSADIHEQHFMVRDGDVKYPLYDILSGNINSDVGNGNYTINYEASTDLLAGVKHSYLRTSVYGDEGDRRFKVEYVGANGVAYFSEIIHQDMLTSQNADALKLQLDFQNNLTDASAFEHTITASGHTFGNDRNGEANEALVFSQNTSVQIPADNTLNFEDRPFTIGFWMNPSQIEEGGATVYSNGKSGAGISLGINAQKKLTFRSHSQSSDYVSDFEVSPDEWTYIVWKYDNVRRKLHLFYNGNPVKTWTNVVSPVASDANVILGNNYQGRRFIGSLDNFFHVGRLMSNEEILSFGGIEAGVGEVLKINGESQMIINGETINNVLNGDFTIEFWGKLNATAGSNYKILASNGRVDNNTTGLSFEYPGSHKLNVVLGNGTSGWTTISEQGDVWQIGEWNHIALSFSSETNLVKYYQNGNLIGETTVNGYVPNSWGMGIGKSPAYSGTLQADMDELRFWKKALTQEEIQAHMHYPMNGNEENLAIYYDFKSEEDTEILISEGTINYELPLLGGILDVPTSPVAEITSDYQSEVTGKWSKINDVQNSGLSFPNEITDHIRNIVFGKNVLTDITTVPGNDHLNYLEGGWQIIPRNQSYATFKINLAEALGENAEVVAEEAIQFFLLKQSSEGGELETLEEGSFDGTDVVFEEIALENAVYYLAWNTEILGVEEVAGINNIQLYPNPTKGKLIIELNNEKAGLPLLIEVYDVTGAKLYEKTETSAAGKQNVQLELFSMIKQDGLLIVKVTLGKEVKTFKVLVKK